MSNISRRFFIGTGATALLGSGCCHFGACGANVRRPKPSERVNLAVIGCGTMGRGNMQAFMQDPRVQVVAVCDPVTELQAVPSVFAGQPATNDCLAGLFATISGFLYAILAPFRGSCLIVFLVRSFPTHAGRSDKSPNNSFEKTRGGVHMKPPFASCL